MVIIIHLNMFSSFLSLISYFKNFFDRIDPSKGKHISQNYEVMIKYELYKALGMYLYNMHIYVDYIDINLTCKDCKARFTTVPLKSVVLDIIRYQC